MTDTIRPARTDTFEHTIAGLLTGALDRTLNVLGYAGDLDAAMPRQKRDVIFGKGELSRAIFEELRNAEGPLSSRDIAREIVTLRGEDARDRKYLSELTKRVSKALRGMKAEGHVRSTADTKGNLMWERRL